MERASGVCIDCGHGRDLVWDWMLLGGVFAYELVCRDARDCRGRCVARRLLASVGGE